MGFAVAVLCPQEKFADPLRNCISKIQYLSVRVRVRSFVCMGNTNAKLKQFNVARISGCKAKKPLNSCNIFYYFFFFCPKTILR